jgi:hypothetical protein
MRLVNTITANYQTNAIVMFSVLFTATHVTRATIKKYHINKPNSYRDQVDIIMSFVYPRPSYVELRSMYSSKHA